MPTGANNLGTQLGQLLFGRPDDNKSYYEGQAIGSLVNDRMASAAKDRAAAMIDQDRLTARQGVTPQALTAAGFADNQAPLLGSVLRANDVVDLGRLGALQAPTAGQALADAGTAIRGGNMDLGNALLALAGGKPVETTRVTDGQVFNPYGDSGQDVRLTALGQAAVAGKQAEAQDRRASAGEHAAHTRLYDTQSDAGGFAPNKAGSNPSTPSMGALGAVLGTTLDANGYPVIPADQMRRFLAFQTNNAATDPRYNDGDYALRQFAAQHDAPEVVPAPVGAPPAAPARLGEALTQGTAPPLAPPKGAPANARQAPDGHFYVPDPQRPGKYLRVDG